ncbi:hypothetical protein SBI_09725 [Streptomyces bingchenggensis BCW-1]|uniref:Uncharacterized protein n=1 Tax=Streptomyces bingchenggensis (strain BCW-1) TaxID=749414 RepID=D7CBG6_STRBB|nr:hypothetical protein SBI_09725 [Streptomyces bingchenggensis BCW-1]
MFIPVGACRLNIQAVPSPGGHDAAYAGSAPLCAALWWRAARREPAASAVRAESGSSAAAARSRA